MNMTSLTDDKLYDLYLASQRLRYTQARDAFLSEMRRRTTELQH